MPSVRYPPLRRANEIPANRHAYILVTCQDARLDPAKAFGISLGEAHVIRNAGGDAADAMRSLIISQQMLGTNAIFLVKHSGEFV